MPLTPQRKRLVLELQEERAKHVRVLAEERARMQQDIKARMTTIG
jgi:hypothetical protein